MECILFHSNTSKCYLIAAKVLLGMEVNRFDEGGAELLFAVNSKALALVHGVKKMINLRECIKKKV